MPQPRELTDVAIDLALHNLGEPASAWRDHLPLEDLGSMVDAGSGQIALQAAVAALQYGDRPSAVRTLTNYAALCPRRIMLSEPWSLIYGRAIVSCWAATVVIADRVGERALANLFRDLLSRWAGTCALMVVDGKVIAAGCRGWGHDVRAGGWDDTWAVACGRVPSIPGSKRYGTPGAYDDWGWLARCDYVARDVYRAAASPFLGRDWRSLLPSIPRWGARTEMQLLGWEDGSRLWLMGDDEAELDDEDANGNTPGLLAAGVMGGKVISLPKWPDPVSGMTHLRQVNCVADLDGDPEHGWTLFHSHLGDKQLGTGFTTSLPAYTASPLAFWVSCPAGQLDWSVKVPGSVMFPDPPPPVVVPPVPAPVQPKRKRFQCPCSKLWRKLRGRR
jgi:hypothetical protein